MRTHTTMRIVPVIWLLAGASAGLLAQEPRDRRHAVVATRATIFFNSPTADGPTELKPGQREPTYVSTILSLTATVTSRDPLLLDFEITADNDRVFAAVLR